MEHFLFSAIREWNIWCFFTDYSGQNLKVNNSEGCHGILANLNISLWKHPGPFSYKIIRTPKEGR